MPEEGYLSAICEAFTCTPDVALQQDPSLVLPILEFRMAMMAKEIHNRDVAEMAKYPGLVRFWREMTSYAEEQSDG